MKPFTLSLRGKIVEVSHPLVMGIVNVTPDSFYGESRSGSAAEAAEHAARMVAEGADIIDVGACSTRPGSTPPPEEEELQRAVEAVEAIRRAVPGAFVSIDTFRSRVAEAACRAGADIVNDFFGGALDEQMHAVVARLQVPYILTHSRGNPSDMLQHTAYGSADDTGSTADAVAAAVVAELSQPLHRLRLLGVADVIVDPGFGFPKLTQQSYALLNRLAEVERLLGCPLLVGLSRKSMITGPCGIAASEALAGTCALNAVALLRGAAILRVHDVAAARQTVTVIQHLIHND